MVLISNRQKAIPVDTKSVKRFAASIMSYLGIADHEVSILLLDDRGITKINQRYLGRDGATNVISFSLREGEFGNVNPHVMGDVVISVEKACEQAKMNLTGIEEEIAFLFIHGILHLMGYNHEGTTPRNRSIMEKKQKELFRVVHEVLKVEQS